MKQWLLTLVFLLSPNAFGSAQADRSLEGADISCLTRGVGPFQKHNGGYQLRIDSNRGQSQFASGEFWSVAAAYADGLLTTRLGSESLNVVTQRSADGNCVLLVNQVNDVDGNEMDIRITVNPRNPADSQGRLSMILNGRSILPEHGRLSCQINPEYAQNLFRTRCEAMGRHTDEGVLSSPGQQIPYYNNSIYNFATPGNGLGAPAAR